MRLLLLVLLAALAAGANAAGKVTSDPNAAGAVAQVAASADARLAARISFDGGYNRLRDVCADIKAQAGLPLSCGQSSFDWHVRDIPVVAHAHDMPAGEMLKALAACSHTQFISLRIAGEAQKNVSYSLLRTKSGEQAMTAPAEARLKAAQAKEKWAWDCLAAARNLPKNEDRRVESICEHARIYGSLLHAVGTSVRDQVLNGAIAKLPLAPLAKGASRNSIYNLLKVRCMISSIPIAKPDPELTGCFLKLFYARPGKSDGGLRVTIYMVPPPKREVLGFGGESWVERHLVGPSLEERPLELARQLVEAKIDGIRPEPPAPAVDPAEGTFPGEPFKPLVKDGDWDVPELQAKLPEGKQEASLSEALDIVSKTGLNVFCEDFRTHKDPSLHGLLAEATKDATAASVLRGIQGIRWFYDPKGKTLLGWESDWPDHHARLVPESILKHLKAAMNGPGAEIDDVAPILALDEAQLNEWVLESRDLSYVQADDDDVVASLWWLYDKLTPDQRTMAKSKAGLALAAISPAYLKELASRLNTFLEENAPRAYMTGSEEATYLERAIDGINHGIGTLKVPSKKLVRLHIGFNDDKGHLWSRIYPGFNDRKGHTWTSVRPPEGMTKHTYRIWLEGGNGDTYFSLRSSEGLRVNFPVLAAERKPLETAGLKEMERSVAEWERILAEQRRPEPPPAP